MKDSYTKTAVMAMTAVLAGSAPCIAVADPPQNLPRAIAPLARPPLLIPPRPATFHPPQLGAPAIPREEPRLATSPNAGFASPSVFSAATSTAVTPNAQTLNGPVTLIYSGSSPAFELYDSGTSRGLTASIANTSDASSALYGDTVGEGAGLTGYNLGTVGPGGKFEVTNASSAQPGAFASTNGTGPALLATITNTSSGYAAVYGQNLASQNGYGVEGEGNVGGVFGLVPSNSTSTEGTDAVVGVNYSKTNPGNSNFGVAGYAYGNGIGIGAAANSGYGVSATSNSNYAVYALTSTGTAAIYAENDWADKGYGVYASVTNGTAIYGSALGNGGAGVQGYSSNGFGVVGSDEGDGYGVYGTALATGGEGVVGVSTNGFGVDGEDTGTGVGIYGASKSGYAGYFDGNVYISGELQVVSTVYTSDRNLKSDIQPIDGKEVLARVSQLPISSWHYTSAPDKRHVGPMAQDFHAAFGLNGADDTHISEVDIGGVSLAAIQELNSQMKSQMQTKDAQIAALQAQVAEQMKVKDAQIAELNVQVAKLEGQTAELKAKAAGFEAQAVAQTQAMAQVQQTLSARMTALEHRGVASTQAVALEQSAKQRVAID